jgi:hypothetical protein
LYWWLKAESVLSSPVFNISLPELDIAVEVVVTIDDVASR